MIFMLFDFFEEEFLGVLGVVFLGVGDDEGGNIVFRNGFLLFLNVIVDVNVGIKFEMLLLLIFRVVRVGNVVSELGIELFRLLLFKRICCNVVMFVKNGEIVLIKFWDVSDMEMILVLEYVILVYVLYGFVLI